MITSLRYSIRKILIVAGIVALMGVGSGCSTSNLLTYAQASRQKGLRQFEAGDYQAAAGSFRSATRQDPRDYKSFYYLGTAYDKLNAPEQAAQAYHSALKVMDVTLEGKADKETRAKSIDGLAIAIAKGQDRVAHLNLPRPEKRPAEDAWLRAKVARYTGDADAAIESYAQASFQDPDNFYLAKDYALYLADLGQTETATTELRRAYRLNSRDDEVNAALTRVGTVPGPALKEKDQLAKPVIPRGPLPEWKMPQVGGAKPAPANDQNVAPTTPTVQAPRD